MTKCLHCGYVPTLNQLEAKAIEDAYIKSGRDFTKTAISLGIGRATLYRKFKQYGINSK